MTKYSSNKEREFIPLKIAILCISDTRNIKSDESGSFLKDRVIASGHNCSDHLVVRDDINQIVNQLIKLVNRSDVDVVISRNFLVLMTPLMLIELELWLRDLSRLEHVWPGLKLKYVFEDFLY